MGKGKPSGIRAGGKLRNHRREQRWNDKNYNSANIDSKWKRAFGTTSHASGIVTKKVAVEAKQPNSACRKCVRVQLKKNNRGITAFVPLDGSLDYIDENDRVLCAGLGRKGKSTGDLPGVRFKVVHVANLGLRALFLKKKDKPRGRA
jgi:small subunit ribosomal protein S23e